MMTKKERQQLYEENRPYYGYTMKEWSNFNYIAVDHIKCSTCHRMKIIDNFISEYSG